MQALKLDPQSGLANAVDINSAVPRIVLRIIFNIDFPPMAALSRPKDQKFRDCLDAVVIVLIPLMRRFVPFPKFLEPTDQP
jgi:hypothetical protein